MRASLGIACSLFLASSPAFAVYNLVENYSGSNFFSGWDFKDGFDNTTNGDVNYLNQTAANSDGIISTSGAGNTVIIKVDNTTNVPNQQKRNSVFLSTQQFFSVGSVFVFDAVHIPAGCSVWPSFWTRGPNWPVGGEIDILENVNLATNNQMTLHTSPGCTQPANVTQTGTVSSTNCSAGVDAADGCTVIEKQADSFGTGFNDAGGGVWAAQFDVSGVFVWFWSRSNVPSSVTNANNTVDPSSWGTPSAAWPATSCNVTEFFTPQQLVLDITLCGDFAGQPSIYQSTCGKPGENVTLNTCYTDNVNGTGSNYADAYFEINYVKVFSVSSGLSPTVSGSSTILTSATSAATSGTGNSNSSTNKNGSSGGWVGPYVAIYATVFCAFAAFVAGAMAF